MHEVNPGADSCTRLHTCVHPLCYTDLLVPCCTCLRQAHQPYRHRNYHASRHVLPLYTVHVTAPTMCHTPHRYRRTLLHSLVPTLCDVARGDGLLHQNTYNLHCSNDCIPLTSLLNTDTAQMPHGHNHYLRCTPSDRIWLCPCISSS